MSDPDHPKPEARAFPSPMSRGGMRYGWGRFQGREVGVKSPTPRGTLPFWSRNCRELFFQNLDNPIMVTDYTATAPAEDKGDVHLTC